jgi:tyrosinase
MNAPSHNSRPHGAYEAVPHDLIHGFVGGNMGNPDLAANDPIFFCHHANVDRMWEEWLALGQGRANPSSDVWLDQQFTFFDENKQQVTIRVRDMLDTATLGYSYDTIGTPAPNVARPTANTATENLVVVRTPGQSLSARPVHVMMSIPEASVGRLQRNLLGARTPLAAVPSQVQLRLEGVKFSGVPDSAVAVYLNLPKDARPDPRSPYFAGCFTFFDHDHGGARTSHLDVTKHLQRLWPYSDRSSRDVKVTLVRTSCGTLPHEFETTCTCGQLSLAACK